MKKSLAFLYNLLVNDVVLGLVEVFLVVWNRSVIMSLVRANRLSRQANNAKINPQKMKTLLSSILDRPIPRHDMKPHSVIGSLIVSRYFPPRGLYVSNSCGFSIN